jgi:hypothetical protein
MHSLNQNLSKKGEGDTVGSQILVKPSHYILAIVFLASLFFGVNSFSFDSFTDSVLETSDDICQASLEVENIICTEMVVSYSKVFSGQGLDIPKIVSFEKSIDFIGQTGFEFLSGVDQGIKISLENIFFVKEGFGRFLERSIVDTKSSLSRTVGSANQQFAKVSKIDFDWRNNLAQVYSSGPSFEFKVVNQDSFDLKKIKSYFVRAGYMPVLFVSHIQLVEPARQAINTVLFFVIDGTNFVLDSVSIAWKDFFSELFGQDGSDLSQSELRDQLKKEILEELQRDNTIDIKDGDTSSTFTDSGLVLMKSSGINAIDVSNLKKIKDSFSDRVLVNFDKTGESGDIQPIFRDGLGEKYMFVITPVKR